MKRSVAASIAKRTVKKIWNVWSSYANIDVVNDCVKITIDFIPWSELAREEAYKFAQDIMDDIPVEEDSQSWYSVHEELRGTLTMYKTDVKRKVLEEIKNIIGD